MTKRERLFDMNEFARVWLTGEINLMKDFIDDTARRQIKAFSEEITVGYKANHWKSDTPMSDAINTALKLRGIKP